MLNNISAGQSYALISFALIGIILCVLGLYDTIVVIATGHDSQEILVLLRFTLGLFGLSGAGSTMAIVKHINDNGDGS